ncbi:MAG: nucleotidyltransferase domain-containing protein [archaeon GB-1867-097]|nr:nucleotidyltransferase domain-containing protein [Candidatus Culexmicrobium thermophilum]
MSLDILVKRALMRREAFKNLNERLKTIKDIVHKLDPKAEVFLFGSVAEGKHNYSSDIDVLIVTELHPAKILSELWRAEIKEPFEIHVHPPEKAAIYKNRAKLLRI